VTVLKLIGLNFFQFSISIQLLVFAIGLPDIWLMIAQILGIRAELRGALIRAQAQGCPCGHNKGKSGD